MNTAIACLFGRRFGAVLAAWSGLAAILVLAGCISARHTEPHAPPLQLADARLQQGRQVFYQQCHMCHLHGGTGLGPAIVNKPLPSFLMKIQVRHGLGAMPSFKEDKISDQELDALIGYIKAVMANKPHPERVEKAPRR